MKNQNLRWVVYGYPKWSGHNLAAVKRVAHTPRQAKDYKEEMKAKGFTRVQIYQPTVADRRRKNHERP